VVEPVVVGLALPVSPLVLVADGEDWMPLVLVALEVEADVVAEDVGVLLEELEYVVLGVGGGGGGGVEEVVGAGGGGGGGGGGVEDAAEPKLHSQVISPTDKGAKA